MPLLIVFNEVLYVLGQVLQLLEILLQILRTKLTPKFSQSSGVVEFKKLISERLTQHSSYLVRQTAIFKRVNIRFVRPALDRSLNHLEDPGFVIDLNALTFGCSVEFFQFHSAII